MKQTNHTGNRKSTISGTTVNPLVSLKEKVIVLTEEQKIMLQMGLDDIKNGDLLSQDELDEDNKWLIGK